jgi:hypothetical protein
VLSGGVVGWSVMGMCRVCVRCNGCVWSQCGFSFFTYMEMSPLLVNGYKSLAKAQHSGPLSRVIQQLL